MKTYKAMNKSGFILPLLIFITIIMFGITGYLYLKTLQIDKPELVKQLEEKVSDKVDIDNWIKTPAEITITKDGFVPATVSIIAGQQVTFVNQDENVHRVIPSPPTTVKSLPEFDSEDLQPSDSFTYSFENIGTFTVGDNKNSGKHQATVMVR